MKRRVAKRRVRSNPFPPPPYPDPGDPYNDDDLREIFLYSENSEPLVREEMKIRKELANKALVSGSYDRMQAVTAFSKWAARASAAYRKEIGTYWDEGALRGHAFTPRTMERAATWQTLNFEHEAFGKGMGNLFKMARGVE